MPLPQLLFLVHRIPYPPNKGDKIRSYHLLRYLSERYRVHLGTFVDDENDWRYLPEVEKLCADVCAVRLDPRRQRLWSLRAFLKGEPLSLPYYRSAKLATWVGRKILDDGITRMLVFSSPMAQYFPTNGADVRKVVDFVDVDSEKWRQYAVRHRWPMRWLYRREGERLLEYERCVASFAHASWFVTEQEVELFKSRTCLEEGSISPLRMGVDAEYFSPDWGYANPYRFKEPVIVFTGMMDYWANIDAVMWFAREILPGVRERMRGTRFTIVGARPTRQVERLGALPGVDVTGAVPDVRPYLAHAHVSVAPMRVARGVQSKILEAFAMTRAVVVTPDAVQGLDLPGELRRYSADSAEDFAGAVVTLLSSKEERERIGSAGRAWVRQHHDWSETLKPVAALIENEVVHGRA